MEIGLKWPTFVLILCFRSNSLSFPHQSTGETEVSIVAQNKDCYESGIVCMKILVIHVGLTKIYFTDNSGNPVHSHTVTLVIEQAATVHSVCFHPNVCSVCSPLQNPSTVVGRGSEFELWTAGYYTVLHFSSQDLTILWDRKTTVHIRVGPHWKVRT